MKTIKISLLAVVLITACQTDNSEEKLREDIRKREIQIDSIHNVNELVKQYQDGIISLMKAGATKEEAYEKSKAIFPEGYRYDSISNAK
jgi:uncharacterized lipoprotein YehR (DUF1307 family)